MNNKIIAAILAVAVIILSVGVYAVEEETNYDIKYIRTHYDQALEDEENAKTLVEVLGKLGVDENHILMSYANAILKVKTEDREYYESLMAEVVEYPEAEIIWKELKAQGWNDAVCAGIMGNIMVEVGGFTLNIDPYAYNPNYYGICQWSRYYCPDVVGEDLDGQIEYLFDTIKYEMDTFGYMYYEGFNYDTFIKMEKAEDAALSFAKVFERCGSSSYDIRMKCARVAYNYFGG